jgi:predicted nucleic acid-binding protein
MADLLVDTDVFIDHLKRVDRLPRIAERAGEIRRTAGIRLPDALIAATALVHQLPLRDAQPP